MKPNSSRSETGELAEELAGLRRLDHQSLKQRWRALYRSEAPARIGRALLLQAVAYRLQERGLGGLKVCVANLNSCGSLRLKQATAVLAPAIRVDVC
jgi:hypothetical protein